jgi:hypothetical protein
MARAKRDVDGLSPRERQVLALDAEGLRPAEIAKRLGISRLNVGVVRYRLKEAGHALKVVRKAPVDKTHRYQREKCRCGLTLPCNQCLAGSEYVRLVGSSAAMATAVGDDSRDEYDVWTTAETD